MKNYSMFLGRGECSNSSRSHFIFFHKWLQYLWQIHLALPHSLWKPCNSLSISCCVQPCDSCLSCLRYGGGASPSCDDEVFAVSHSWTPHIHPAGMASVFSFHMVGVTPHSCYNFSVVHKNLPSKPQSHVFWIFPLFVPIYSISLHFLNSLSVSQTHTLTHIAYTCVHSNVVHLLSSCWYAHLLLMKAFHLGAFEDMVVSDNRLSESGTLCKCRGFPEELTAHRPTKGNGVWQREQGGLVVWFFDTVSLNHKVLILYRKTRPAG